MLMTLNCGNAIFMNIRDEHELHRIQNYIRQNPEKWQKDKEFFKILLERMVKR